MRTSGNAPRNTEQYLHRLPAGQRDALLQLREQVMSAVPAAVEHFGYGLPGFKYKGKVLIYIGAAKDHCALYGSIPSGFTEKLKGFALSKGTIRFVPERPVPASVVKALIKRKAAEIDARTKQRQGPSSSRKPAPGK